MLMSCICFHFAVICWPSSLSTGIPCSDSQAEDFIFVCMLLGQVPATDRQADFPVHVPCSHFSCNHCHYCHHRCGLGPGLGDPKLPQVCTCLLGSQGQLLGAYADAWHIVFAGVLLSYWSFLNHKFKDKII